MHSNASNLAIETGWVGSILPRPQSILRVIRWKWKASQFIVAVQSMATIATMKIKHQIAFPPWFHAVLFFTCAFLTWLYFFAQANVISSSWSFLLSNSVWFKLLCCAWSDQLFTSAQTNGYVNTFHRLIMMNSWTHWKRDGEQRQIHRQYVNKAMRFEFPNLCIATSVAGVSAGTSGFSGASCDSWAVGMCFPMVNLGKSGGLGLQTSII